MADYEKITTDTEITLDVTHTGPAALVVSIDIGCTHSAVSVAFLSPGQAPLVRMIKKWGGPSPDEAKTPTLVAYRNGTYVAAGFKALEYEGNTEYKVAKLFKPYLHPENSDRRQKMISIRARGRGRPNQAVFPKTIPAKRTRSDVLVSSDEDPLFPPLPEGVSLTGIYTDFLGFLFRRTESFIFEHTMNGKETWQALKDQRTIVITTPNGWGHDEQEFLRDVAIRAGLVTEQSADRLLEFVTESEASVHFVVTRSAESQWLKPGVKFGVVDAGGSTVDSTLYQCVAVEPGLVLKEIPGRESLQAGGIFIDHEARTTLVEKLGNSRYFSKLNYMVKVFEQKVKRRFDGTQAVWRIWFGIQGDDDKDCDIKDGNISLSLFEMRSAFDNTVRKIVNNCRQLCRGKGVEYLILVGGFGECSYLQRELKTLFDKSGTEVVTVDSPTKKAAAEGATVWFIRQLVVARAAQLTLGAEHCPVYEPENPIHRQRPHKVYRNVAGVEKIRGLFDVWVEKGDIVQANFQKIITYRNVFETQPDFIDAYSIVVYQWNFPKEPLSWCRVDNGKNKDGELMPGLTQLCCITADLTDVLTEKVGTNGQRYWELNYEVAIRLGGTKLQAQLRWNRGGQTYNGPITVFRDPKFQ